MKHIGLAAVVFAVALSSGIARADVQGDVEQEMQDDMYQMASGDVGALTEYGQCRAMLKLANKKLKASTKLRSPAFEKVPNAVADGNSWVITVADIPWICDQVDLTLARGTLWTSLTDGKRLQELLATDPPLDERAKYKEGDYWIGQAKACTTNLGKEKANGATTLEWQGQSMSLDDAAPLCDVLAKYGDYVNRSGQQNFDKLAEKYRALGVAGDRLELFVEYDDVSFLGKKCVGIDDIKKLVKAKAVYQWLDNSDGTITIRKYTFKKNKYKVSEKTYLTEAKAYKGCK
jgi:hypothetical protein